MATITEHNESPSGGDVQEQFGRKYRRHFIVDTGNETLGPAYVMSLGGLPALFAPYAYGGESDAGALVTNRDFKRRSGARHIWDVEIEYSTKSLEPGQQNDNPTERPPDVAWESERVEEVADLDRNGNPILNTAGQPYDPPLMRDYKLRTLVYTRNEPTFDWSLSLDYEDTINSSTFLGKPAFTWRVLDIDARRAFEEGELFWVVTYRLQYKRRGWKRKVMSLGFKDKDGKEILDEHGNRPSEPWKLDANGDPIKAAGAPGHTQTFEIFDHVDFTPLNITGI